MILARNSRDAERGQIRLPGARQHVGLADELARLVASDHQDRGDVIRGRAETGRERKGLVWRHARGVIDIRIADRREIEHAADCDYPGAWRGALVADVIHKKTR